MLTHKGISYKKPGIDDNVPALSFYKINGTNRQTFINVSVVEEDNSCCLIKNIVAVCSLCCIRVTIPADKVPEEKVLTVDDKNTLMHLMNAKHNHDINVTEIKMENDERIFMRANGTYVDSNGIIADIPATSLSQNLFCAFCNQNYRSINFKKGITIDLDPSKFCGRLSYEFIFCRRISKYEPKLSKKEGMEDLFSILKTYISSKSNELSYVPQITIKDEIASLIKIGGKCGCGHSNVIECGVCGTNHRSSKNHRKLYKKIANEHFGKKRVMYNYRDLVSENDMSTSCIICGEIYDFAPSKHIVLSHFEMCRTKNKEYFISNGYSCVYWY